MNLGIDRGTIGDIFLMENEGYVFCLENIADYQDAFGGMFNTPSDQVKNFIDSNAAVIDTRVKTYNETIAKLK